MVKLIKLTPENIKKDKFLNKHLKNRPKYTKTATLTPNKELWFRFKEVVEEALGANKMSRVINWITEYWVDHVNPTKPPADIDGEIYKTTLTVDHDLWDRFVDKIFLSFSRYRMQTVIINDIIEQYLEKHYPLVSQNA